MRNITGDEFSKLIKDYYGVRWVMKTHANENQFDALINGLRVSPKPNLIAYRNQQVKQKSGFDGEPVMKLYYLFDQLPVELQLLGGNLEGYMCAKGYPDHKTKLQLPPMREELSVMDWNARLGMCIDFFETNNNSEFHQMMLSELIGNEVNYNYDKQFVLDSAPLTIENNNYRLPLSHEPAFQIASF